MDAVLFTSSFLPWLLVSDFSPFVLLLLYPVFCNCPLSHFFVRFKSRRKEVCELLCQFFRISCLTLPDHKDFPAFFSKLSEISFVSCNITFPFSLPEFGICGRSNPTVTAFVHMPETAVNKYDIVMSG